MPEKQKIQKLKDYFIKREDIVMAFLFGSRAKENKIHEHSDWDIAVYFTPEKEDPLDPDNTRIHGIIEWEEQDREYPEEDKVWSDIMDILKTDDVDLIVLNRASASIADSAIRGLPLVIKNRWLYLEFMLLITREAEDFRYFINDYYEIFQRSKSLTEFDRHRLKRIIMFLEERISLYNYYANFNFSDYSEDIHKRGDVERWTETIMNAVIDIAKIILASEKKAPSLSYRETMDRAIWKLKLPDEFKIKFDKWVEFRNILAHEYLDIKWKRIDDFIKNSEQYFQEFIKKVKEFLKNG